MSVIICINVRYCPLYINILYNEYIKCLFDYSEFI